MDDLIEQLKSCFPIAATNVGILIEHEGIYYLRNGDLFTVASEEIISKYKEQLSYYKNISKEKDEFFQKLKALCLKYDKKAWYFPDPELVGLDILKFYLHPDVDLSQERVGNQYKEIDKLYKLELDKN